MTIRFRNMIFFILDTFHPDILYLAAFNFFLEGIFVHISTPIKTLQ
jgi:hypothetical protein